VLVCSIPFVNQSHPSCHNVAIFNRLLPPFSATLVTIMTGLSYISTPSSNLRACRPLAPRGDRGENARVPRRPARVSERAVAAGDDRAGHCPRRVGSRRAGAVAECASGVAGCDLIGEWPRARSCWERESFGNTAIIGAASTIRRRTSTHDA